ncbi:hypothetical protein ABT112_02175 [Streptomyces sp. NPDC002055]|uniref:hypothetical protein n=1 Tax=Streptomyces sp. NPDC002055 TaxID=3154534 RepID=UPI00332E2CF6
MAGDEGGSVEAEEHFRSLLLTLGNLRKCVAFPIRKLASQVGVPRSTLVSWLKDATIPDEVDRVRKAADLLLDAARNHPDASASDYVVRLDRVDWARAHAAAQNARAEGRSRSARTGSARRAQSQQADRSPVQHQVVPRNASSWTARQLGIHAAVPGGRGDDDRGEFALPDYVPREHDARVRARLRYVVEGGEAALLVLRGGSCTGKTRTAYEAVRDVVPNWRLLYPKTAQALVEALAGSSVVGQTVLWLDDLHRLLAEPAGEDAAVALLEVLERPGPVAAVATIWPENYQALVATPVAGQADRHRQSRALLRCGWMVDVPVAFTGQAWQEFQRRAAADASLSAVAAAAGAEGAVTQTLAAGPELLDHWRQAPDACGKALITAAVDARRLGIRSPLPETFLQQAVSGYLTPRERGQAKVASWFEEALDYARRPIKQVTSALLPVAPATGMGAVPGVVDLADYLEQHVGDLRWDQVPPASFWDAALEHVAAGEDLERLAIHAFSRSRYRISRDLYLRALARGHSDAVEGLCFSYAETGRILTSEAREELAAHAREVDDGGYSLWYVGSTLATVGTDVRDKAMCAVAAELLAESIDAGYFDAAHSLAGMWQDAGFVTEAAQLLAYTRAAEAKAPGTPSAPGSPLVMQIEAALAAPANRGNERERIEATPHEIRALGRRLATTPRALPSGWLTNLPALGEVDLTEKLLRALIDAGSRPGYFSLENFLRAQGRHDEATALLPTAAEEGDDLAVVDLVSRWSTTRPEEVRNLLERCRRTGRTKAVILAVRALLMRPQPAAVHLAEEFLTLLAKDGSSAAQLMLALWHLDQWQEREPAPDEAVPSKIIALLKEASAHEPEARRLLGQHAQITGDAPEAERHFRGAVDGGDYTVLADLAPLLPHDSPEGSAKVLRHGLEADGSVSPAW